MICPLPRTGPSRRCRLQLTTKIKLSSLSRDARVIALDWWSAGGKERFEAGSVNGGGGAARGDVPADVVLHAIGAHHHGQRVPANQALDAALEFLIAGEKRLESSGNGVGVRRVGG